MAPPDPDALTIDASCSVYPGAGTTEVTPVANEIRLFINKQVIVCREAIYVANSRNLIESTQTVEEVQKALSEGRVTRTLSPLLERYEKQQVLLVPPKDQWAASFNCWGLKESYFAVALIILSRMTADYYLRMANLYLRAGNDKAAQEAGAIAAAIYGAMLGQNTSVSSGQWYGRANWTLNKYLEVLAYFSKGLRTERNMDEQCRNSLDRNGATDSNVLYLRGVSLLRAGDYKGAKQTLESVRKSAKKDPQRCDGLYPPDYELASYNYVLGLDLDLADISYRLGENVQALAYLKGNVCGQDPEYPPGAVNRDNERPPRINNYLRALMLLFSILTSSKAIEADVRNADDARALYRYFLYGEEPAFTGSYKTEVAEIFATLKKQKDLFWQAEVFGRLGISEAKLKEQVDAIDLNLAGQILMRVEQRVGNEDKGIKPQGTWDPEPDLKKARMLLERFFTTRDQQKEKASAKVMEQAVSNWVFLAFLHLQWAKQAAENEGRSDVYERNIQAAQGALKEFYARVALTPGLSNKVHQEALGCQAFVAANYAGWARQQAEAGQDFEPQIKKAKAELDKFFNNASSATDRDFGNALKTLSLIAYVYIYRADAITKNSFDANAGALEGLVANALDALKKLEEKSRQINGTTRKETEESKDARANILKLKAYLAAVYAKWAENLQDAGKSYEDKIAKAEDLLKEVEELSKGITADTVGVWIAIASAYVSLKKIDQAEAILQKLKDVLGNNWIAGLKAVFTLSWIQSEHLKAVKKTKPSTEAEQHKKDAAIRQYTQNIAAISYALLYGEAAQEGSGVSLKTFSAGISDPLVRSYLGYIIKNHSALLAAGNKKGEGDKEIVFQLSKLPYGKSSLMFNLAGNAAQLAEDAPDAEARQLRQFAITLYMQVIKDLDYDVQKEIVQDAIWALAGLTKDVRWVEQLEGAIQKPPAGAEVTEVERYVMMRSTVASLYFVFAMDAKKEGDLEKSKEYLKKSLAHYDALVAYPRLAEMKKILPRVEIFVRRAEVLAAFNARGEAAQALTRAQDEIAKELAKEKGLTFEERETLKGMLFMVLLNRKELIISGLKEDLFSQRIFPQEAVAGAEQVLADLMTIITGLEQIEDPKQKARVQAATLQKLALVYGSLGGFKNKAAGAGVDNFVKAAILMEVLRGRTIESIAWLKPERLQALLAADPVFRQVMGNIVKGGGSLNLLEAAKRLGIKNKSAVMAIAHLLKAAGEKEEALLPVAAEYYKAAIAGIEPDKASPADWNIYLEGQIGLAEVNILSIQAMVQRGVASDLQAAREQLAAQLKVLLVLSQDKRNSALNQLKLYKMLIWVYGTLGGLAEKMGKEGDGQAYFKEAVRIFEQQFIKVGTSEISLYTAGEKPHLGEDQLRETETTAAQLKFDYLELRRAALKKDKDVLEITDIKEAEALLALYSAVRAEFKEEWSQRTVDMAILEFKTMLANHYKKAGKLDLWFKYLKEVIDALEKTTFPAGEPKTEKEAEVRLKTNLLLAAASAAYAYGLKELIGETKEVKKLFIRAARCLDWVLSNQGTVATPANLKKQGLNIYDVKLAYLNSRLESGSFDDDPIFAAIEKELKQLDEKRRTTGLDATERKYFIEAKAALGSFYIWNEDHKDAARARGYYEKAVEESQKVSASDQQNKWFKDAMLQVFRGMAWVALDASKGVGWVVRWGTKADYDNAAEKLQQIVGLFVVVPNPDSEQIHALGFAYYALGELNLRGRHTPDLALAAKNYRLALDTLEKDKIGGKYRSIAVMSLAADAQKGLAEIYAKQKNYPAARESLGEYRNILQLMEDRVEELKQSLGALSVGKSSTLGERLVAADLAAMRTWEAQLAEAHSAGLLFEWGENDYQGKKENTLKGGASGEAGLYRDEDNLVKMHATIKGGKLDRSITGSSSQAAGAEIDRQIADLRKQIETGQWTKDGCKDVNCAEKQIGRLEEEKQLLQAEDKAITLLETTGQMDVALGLNWERHFGQIGTLRSGLLGEMQYTCYQVYDPSTNSSSGETFTAYRLELNTRFTFEGFRPIGDMFLIQPYVEGSFSVAFSSKQNALVELNKNAVDSVTSQNYLDETARQTLLKRSGELDGGIAVADGQVNLGTNLILMNLGRYTKGIWEDISLDLGAGYKKDTWNRTSRLFFPQTVTNPLYFVNPTASATQALDVDYWMFKAGLSTRFYLPWGIILALGANASVYLDKKGYDFGASAKLIFTRFPVPVELDVNYNRGEYEQRIFDQNIHNEYQQQTTRLIIRF